MLYARHMQDIDDLSYVIRDYGKRATRRVYGHEFGMINRYRATVNQMHVERLKRHRPVEFSNSVGGHDRTVGLHCLEIEGAIKG
jgi:hypothetical protein